MKLLVTGATGFVGARFCSRVRSTKDWSLVGLSRTAPDESLSRVTMDYICTDLTSRPDLVDKLRGIDVVIHLASRVHHVDEKESSAILDLYRDVNVHATRHLAEQAARAGVKRFVFVSSIKVNGERTVNHPFSGADQPAPLDAYARSKMEAEQELVALAQQGAIEVVILRPPLVYGPGVRANFLSLLRLVQRGLPLPLGSVRNRRSLLYVDNLCEALVVAATSPSARNKIFTLADDEVVSTGDLIGKLSSNMGRRARLLPFPVGALQGMAFITGLGQKMSRLVESLEADNSDFKRETGWKPLKSIDEGLRETTQWFLSEPH